MSCSQGVIFLCLIVVDSVLKALEVEKVKRKQGLECAFLKRLTVKLIAPVAMNEGLRFAVREGGRTVGAGVVTKIIE